jgi:hypothetical protein
MLDPYQLTVHTLTLRQLGTAEQLAEVTGQPLAEVEAGLSKAVAEGAVIAAKDKYMITPAGRSVLEDAYPVAFAAIRESAEVREAMDAFESGVNKQVLALTTEWQTREAGADDMAIIDKLARVHEKTAKVLRPLVSADPLVDRFLDRIGEALTRAEGGETDYVSGVRVDSVHTVWFQMHEHLLRLTGRERPE